MTPTKLLVAAVLLALSGEARAFDLAPSVDAESSSGGAWAPLRAFGFGGAVSPNGEKTAFDRILFGLDGGIGGLDARFASAEGESGVAGISARIGYAFDGFVAYGAAGVAFASSAFAQSPGAARPTAAGYVVVGGVETALFAGVAARVEYLYVDLDRSRIDQTGDVALTPAGGQIRAGFNYRF
jgi:outer membrane immunogenic protein